MPLPPKLNRELDELKSTFVVQVREEADIINFVFSDFQLGDGFNRRTSDLLIRIPRSYPDAGPDMFWTVPEVLLATGQAPQCAEVLEVHLGRQWRRFSWHKKSWNSVSDNIHSYIEFVYRRLRQKQ